MGPFRISFPSFGVRVPFGLPAAAGIVPGETEGCVRLRLRLGPALLAAREGKSTPCWF